MTSTNLSSSISSHQMKMTMWICLIFLSTLGTEWGTTKSRVEAHNLPKLRWSTVEHRPWSRGGLDKSGAEYANIHFSPWVSCTAPLLLIISDYRESTCRTDSTSISAHSHSWYRDVLVVGRKLRGQSLCQVDRRLRQAIKQIPRMFTLQRLWAGDSCDESPTLYQCVTFSMQHCLPTLTALSSAVDG